MLRIVRITESDLRAAMADERYWRVGHPERGAFQNWVGQGFRGLNPSDGEARTTVWVRAYMREGHQVSAHWRSAPPRHGGDAATPPGVNQDVIPINRRGGGRPLLPPSGAGQGNSPTRAIPRAPIRDASGRDRVQELRDDPLTEHHRVLSGEVDQWVRPGGVAGREADLARLNAGLPDHLGDGTTRYILPGNRVAAARPSTSPGAANVPTLEIFRPTARGFEATDKFRYPAEIRNQP